MSTPDRDHGDVRLTPPSVEDSLAITVDAVPSIPASATVVGVLVASSDAVDSHLGFARSQLEAHGFTGAASTTLLIAAPDEVGRCAIGVGDPDSVTVAGLRDAAATFARSASAHVDLAIVVANVGGLAIGDVAQALVEGVMLARYRFDALRRDPRGTPVQRLTLVVEDPQVDEARNGAQRDGSMRRQRSCREIWRIRHTAI